MPFKRGGRKTWTFQARSQTGHKQLGTRTTNKALAGKMEAMWEELASQYRAWDVLGMVFSGALAIGTLYDLWLASERKLVELRRRLIDVDLRTLIVPWYKAHRNGVKSDSANHALSHVLELFGGGTSTLDGEEVQVDASQGLLASAVTTELLTTRLNALKRKRNTLRKYHSSWSVFFAYAMDVKGLFAENPMARVHRPREASPPIQFFEMEAVELIVGSQVDLLRQALFAVSYGTGLEISTALELTTTDLLYESKQIRGPGTKFHTRDRILRAADWAWPTIEAHSRSLPAGSLLFAGVDRYQASKWHRETLVDLGLSTIPLHNARHHWAVRMIRSGAPIRIVQEQLGHESPMLTLRTYGRFRPTGEELNEWERMASARDERRRRARE
jgi:integrase